MRTALGVDAGGTRSRCVLLDEAGRALGVGFAGPGNPLSAGTEVALSSLSDAISSAMLGLEAGVDSPGVVVVSLAGGVEPDELDGLRTRLGAHGVSAEVIIESDLLSSFCSGRATESGYLLLSGTGAVAGRIEGGALVGVADGLGWLLGDEGSGFWIGHEGALAVLRSLDGRGPATSLAAPFLTQFAPEAADRIGRSREVAGAIQHIYRRQRPVALAGFAGEVLAAASGDEVAADIVGRAAQALVASWRAVQAPGVVGTVLAGGVLSRPGPLQDAVVAQIPDAVVVTDGMVGAGLLALRALGVPAGEDERMRIGETLAGLAGRA